MKEKLHMAVGQYENWQSCYVKNVGIQFSSLEETIHNAGTLQGSDNHQSRVNSYSLVQDCIVDIPI